MNLFDLWLRFMKWVLIIAFPLMVLVLVSLPVVDRLSPWPEAETMMDERIEDGFRLCVGMSSAGQRSYLLPNQAELVTVLGSSAQDEQALTMETSRAGFWFVLIFVVGCVGLSLRFSIPHILVKIKSSRTSRS